MPPVVFAMNPIQSDPAETETGFENVKSTHRAVWFCVTVTAFDVPRSVCGLPLLSL